MLRADTATSTARSTLFRAVLIGFLAMIAVAGCSAGIDVAREGNLSNTVPVAGDEAPQSAAPSPEQPTGKPAESIEFDVPPNVGVFRGVTIELLGATASVDPDGGSQLTIRVGVVNDVDITFYSDRTSWILIDPSGRTRSAVSLHNPDGTVARTPIERNTSGELHVVFSTDFLVPNVDNWAFGIDGAAEVPEALALGDAQTAAYPINLEVEGQTAVITENAEAGANDPCSRRLGAVEVTVTDAAVQIEPIDVGSTATTAVRADAGTRWMIVWADARNVSPTEPIEILSCSSTQLPTYEMRLLIDGQTYYDIGDGSLMSGSSGLGHGNEATVIYRFVIPLEAEAADLVWGDDAQIVEAWDLALPPVLGE